MRLDLSIDPHEEVGCSGSLELGLHPFVDAHKEGKLSGNRGLART